MDLISVWWWYGIVCLVLFLPLKGYGAKRADIFEKPTEAKVEANATFFITPRDLKKNHNQYHPIDRSVIQMDRFMVLEQHHYLLNNLGNHWTAAQYIPYRLPERIGATDGLFVYDFYFRHPQDIRYYCMPKSKAYTHFNIVLANLGSFIFDGCYSQRFLDNWFAGINIYGAMTENEWPHTKDAQKIVDAFPQFDIFTHFNLLDSAYYVFTSYSIMHHHTKETGGIKMSKKNTNGIKDTHSIYVGNPTQRYRSTRKLLDERYIETRIPTTMRDGIQHKDERRNFYFYHQYVFNDAVQLYHELLYSRKNNIGEIYLSNKDLPYAYVVFTSTSKQSSTIGLPDVKSNVLLTTLGNEIGIKGDIKRLRLSYQLHTRLENIHFYHDAKIIKGDYEITLPNDKSLAKEKEEQKEQEYYLGCYAQWNLTQDATHQLHVEGTYLLKGYHTLEVAYQNRFLKLAYHSVKHKVPYIIQCGYLPYRFWPQKYKAPSAQQIAASFTCTSPWVAIHPLLSFKRINHHIYYKQLTKNGYATEEEERYDHCISSPMQASDPVNLLTYGGHLNFSFSYFHIDNTILFLRDISSNTKIFKGYMPPYIYTGRYYFAHQPYKKKMAIEVGINLHFKPLYYADGYDIVAQRFYRQKYFATQGSPIMDVFGNYRVGNLKISIKYSCINHHFGEDRKKYYFATPFYPGQKPAADVGIHWSFFD